MKEFLINILKGIGMGAANVIPGVSGGTIALITGIFERLINAIKSFNLEAVRLFFTGRFREFVKHTDLVFLISVGIGIAIAIFTLARILEYLFATYPILVWSYFFGLILASVWFVGKEISRWNVPVILFGLAGVVIAAGITILTPARENDSLWYLFLCGIVATCSMILPGLSGSFVLILLGNYELVWIDAVNNLDLAILVPIVVGAATGLIAFSHFLAWIFKRFQNETLSLLTGFILGSLAILWPWKEVLTTFTDRHGEIKPLEQKLALPDFSNPADHFWMAILMMFIGIVSIWVLEYAAGRKKS